ncbi:phage integrase SAM-like domain-containing protein [Bacillus cereus]|uniref:phage integrase SAM-like domain-containing protein n=1 Tax=Bacillus cereus TaxID=1396 RepID=UPI00211D40F7|nr:phage integrase SAM-like domain-containing protein [Bacillus cereus]
MSSNRLKEKRIKQTRATLRNLDNLHVLFTTFTHVKEAEGQVPGTLRQYRENFHYFIKYLNEKDIAHDLAALDTDIIRNYVLYMRNEKVKFEEHRFKKAKHMTVGLSDSTVNTKLKTLRAFSRYLYEERILVENPLLKVKKLNEPLEEIETLSLD